MSSLVGFGAVAADSPKKENKRRASNISGLNELFGIPGVQDGSEEIALSTICSRRNHKFRPMSPDKRAMLLESIQDYGVIEPCILRPAKDIAYPIDGEYELIAGHNRCELAREAGLETVPCIIKEGLTEEEAEQYEIVTNIQRSFEEMSHSEKAAMLAARYDERKRKNIRREVLDEINSYLETLASPVNIRADEGLSLLGTAGIREVAEEHDLSKNTIARYIRIDTVIDEIKHFLDDGKIGVYAAVELSYISAENQEMFVSLMNGSEYKCDISKAKLIRELQVKGKLTIATMTEVLSGQKVKRKPGTPKGYKVSGKVIQKYFKPEQNDKEIGVIIEKALEMYFEKGVQMDEMHVAFKSDYDFEESEG